MTAVDTNVRTETWLSGRDLVSIEDLTEGEIELILDTAVSFEEVSARAIKKVPTLRGKTVVNLFLEPSTRTRASFEIAGKRLSADVINVSASGSSVVKGESLQDTLQTIEAMNVDGVVLRHWSSGSAAYAARLLGCPIINGGDGCHEHPTQALLDLYTMRKTFGYLRGLSVTLVGDIAHSRVARSLMLGLRKVGAEVRVVAPATLLPVGLEEEYGVSLAPDIESGLDGANIIYVLRVQKERMGRQYFPSSREYAAFFGLNKGRLEKAGKNAVIMHPGPVNRGVEIDSEIVDGAASLIASQVTSGVAVRMAVLYLLVGGGAVVA